MGARHEKRVRALCSRRSGVYAQAGSTGWGLFRDASTPRVHHRSYCNGRRSNGKNTFISLDVNYLLKCRPAQRMF
jgi:hypothetical protein